MSKKEEESLFAPVPNKHAKSPEEVAAQDSLNAKAKLSFASKENAENVQFVALEEDVFYQLTVEAAYAKEYARWQAEGTELKIVVRFTVDKRMDGEPIKNINGETEEDGKPRFYEFLPVKATGFFHGKPSKTRACICALLNQDPEEEFALDDIEDLIGKSCQALLEIKEGKDGTIRNKAGKYKPL